MVRVCRESIWQRKVPPDMQGRVLALQRMISQVSLPLASVIAGPLADRVFEPMFTKNGALSSSIGMFIGVGPGRGVAFLFILLGVINCCITFCALFYPPLANIDTDLKDAVHDTKTGHTL